MFKDIDSFVDKTCQEFESTLEAFVSHCEKHYVSKNSHVVNVTIGLLTVVTGFIIMAFLPTYFASLYLIFVSTVSSWIMLAYGVGLITISFCYMRNVKELESELDKFLRDNY